MDPCRKAEWILLYLQAAWIVDESEGEEEDDDVAADQAMAEAAGTADASDDEDDVSDDEAGRGTTSGRTSEVWPGENTGVCRSFPFFCVRG
jgi:hypothetical protein